MSAITYVKGDATRPVGDGPKIICHICNDIGGWGRGFVVAISKRWPEPEAAYRAWAKREDFLLGSMQLVEVGPKLWVANMVAQRDTKRDASGKPPIRYDAVENCLISLAYDAKDQKASVHMPRIGCGLAGGEWSEIEAIIERTLLARGVAVTVYDFE